MTTLFVVYSLHFGEWIKCDLVSFPSSSSVTLQEAQIHTKDFPHIKHKFVPVRKPKK